MIGCVTFCVAVVNGVLPTPAGVLPDNKPTKDCHSVGKLYTSAVLLENNNIVLVVIHRHTEMAFFCVT